VFSIDYHDATKHHFNRFARSLGYLDWATQPNPFRRYAGAALVELPRTPLAGTVPYDALFQGGVAPSPIDVESIGEFLRCSMGLSAWKEFKGSRWALRVNPSSGNLHPTEAYVVWDGRVCHYASREHAIEERAVLESAAWRTFTAGAPGFLVALTSVHWREAWKYGERAFRYCQHDVGHAIGALRLAAALLGWRLALLTRWSDAQLAAVLGLDREADFAGAEPEEAECIAAVTPDECAAWQVADPLVLSRAAAWAEWHGRANALSSDHADWPIIDRVAIATRCPGFDPVGSHRPAGGGWPEHEVSLGRPVEDLVARGPLTPGLRPCSRPVSSDSVARRLPARTVMLQRRSAVAFDARSTLPKDSVLAMLRRLRHGAPPWDAIDWPPQVHLILFVHRVDGLAPGVYAFLRDPEVRSDWRDAMRPELLWEPVDGSEDMFLLIPADVTWTANRLCCDQDIAADGFLSLGMLAKFEATLRERGEWFYRRLFWECGLIGQVLYLEAEAAGARSTGIGCFYDDAVHEVLGLTGHAWQSLYHFSMGVPVEDTRLTTTPGYPWEASAVHA
jgi:SagB-type dehydrogenase family enzyme